MLTAAGCVYDQIYTLAYLYDIAGNLDPPHRKSRLQPLCHRRRLLAGKRDASGQEMYVGFNDGCTAEQNNPRRKHLARLECHIDRPNLNRRWRFSCRETHPKRASVL
ncbi:hypothetical protein CesoFtcFv8_019096 [Champsocephalus esox]|uniref:Uncharacterized protein n=1 Tax=Champsocephalus esox TaxID=159716 RepID=A0AAN8GQF1_9TELE|nr:hypothetical protein CesoFtcFv8_019096 [Champsocephalus esox]